MEEAGERASTATGAVGAMGRDDFLEVDGDEVTVLATGAREAGVFLVTEAEEEREGGEEEVVE